MKQYSNRSIALNNGEQMPLMGFGTWSLGCESMTRALDTAWEVGYRLIDAAFIYQNQRRLGAWIEEKGIRDELFLTSKLWHTSLHKYDAREELDYTLGQLRTDYLDLYLIHWPNKNVPIDETLGALEEAYNAGKIRAIGVSNFTVRHLQDALATKVPIAVNQFELHPSFYQAELVEFCSANNIAVTAYSPLARTDDFDIPAVVDIARQHDVSAAQVILSWVMSKGIAVIPRSSNPEYIKDNFMALKLELASEELERLDQANEGNRIIIPPFSEFDY